MRLVLILLLLFSQQLKGISDPVYFRHLQVEDGLANNTVFVSFQDSWGFMWFGTKEGLSRYDGTNFRSFKIIPNAEKEGNEFVYSIAQTDDNMLILGTRSGLYEFNPITEKSSSLYKTNADEILKVCKAKNGKIFFLVSGKLYEYQAHGKKIRNINEMDIFKDQRLLGMTLDFENNLWLISQNGELFKYDVDLERFHLQDKLSELKSTIISVLHVPNPNEILVGTTMGLLRYNRQTKNVKWILGSKLGKEIFVRDIISNKSKEYWVASEQGLFIVDGKTASFKSLKKDDTDPYSISDNAVYSLFMDKDSGIWCGTYFGGINYHHPRFNNFRKYFRQKGIPSISGWAVREMYPDRSGKQLWIGTEDAGLNRMDLKTGKIHPIEKFNAIKPFNVHAIAETDKGLWVGTFQDGLFLLNTQSGKIVKHYEKNSNLDGLKSNFIISALRTSTSILLLGSSNGVYEYFPAKDQFLLSSNFPRNLYVFTMLEDKAGRIWAGTIGEGAFCYNPRTGTTENFSHQSRRQNNLSHNSVCGIFEDRAGNIWFSTEGGGISKYHVRSKSFSYFTERNGLPSNMVYVVLEDQKGRFWASTSKGLACLLPGESKWVSFTKDDGLLTDQFNYSSGYISKEGELFFGSVKGLVSFFPDDLFKVNSKAPIFITSFQVNGSELSPANQQNWRSILFRDSIYLRHDESSFSIGFSSLDFAASSTLSYQYWLEGAEDKRTDISRNRNVNFTKLPAGEYRFHVRVLNRQNGNENEKILHIFIAPAWWASTIAYIIYSILLIMILLVSFLLYHKRQRQIRENAVKELDLKKQSEYYSAKMNFVTNIVHEIRTPLTLIKGPLELISEKMNNNPKQQQFLSLINRNTERLSSLTDQLLDFQALESNLEGNNPQKIHIASVLEELISEFEILAESKNLKIQSYCNTGNVSIYIDEEIFHRIISNLLSNAIKYADSEIIIECEVENSQSQTLIFSIANDGALVPADQKEKIFEAFHRVQNKKGLGTGIGLTLARILTERNAGTLTYEYLNNTMNRFILKLPIIG